MSSGELIKKLRLENHMTQEDLGSILGVSRMTVHKWENDLTPNLKRETLIQLSKLFDVSVSEIISGTISSCDTVNEEVVKLSNDKSKVPFFEELIDDETISQKRKNYIKLIADKLLKLDDIGLIQISAYLDGLLTAKSFDE